MMDLVENPNCWFSHAKAHMFFDVISYNNLKANELVWKSLTPFQCCSIGTGCW